MFVFVSVSKSLGCCVELFGSLMRMDGKGCRRRSRRRHNSIENYLANGRVEYSKTCKVQRAK